MQFNIIFSFHDLPHMLVLGITKRVLLKLDSEIYEIVNKYLTTFDDGYSQEKVQFEEYSLWSDDIKDHYQKGVDYWSSWHYIDQIYNPYNINVELDPIEQQQNSLTAFNKIKDVFLNKNNLGKITMIKHIYLKHLIHIIGDIHQPLHTISLYNQKFKKGDIGGNKQNIQVGERKSNLHFYFDSGAYYYNFKDRIHRPLNDTFKEYFENELNNLMNEYSQNQLSIQSQDTDFNEWLKEGYQISKNEIYSQIDLTNNSKINIITDQNHQKNIQLSKRQIVKAGYRLAYTLQSILNQEKGLHKYNSETSTNSYMKIIIAQFIIFLAILIIILIRYSKIKQQLQKSQFSIINNQNISLESKRLHDEQQMV